MIWWYYINYNLNINKEIVMSDLVQHSNNIKSRKSIINLEINSQIKVYQRQLVMLNYSQGDVTEEYNKIIKKIKYLRDGLLEGKLRKFG